MAQDLSYRVSAKGAISVYGLGRFPVTLYPEQWTRLFANQGLAQFIADSEGACQEQQKVYAAAEAVAEQRGLRDKAKDEFIAKLLDMQPKKPTVVTRKAGVDQKLFDMFSGKAASL